MSYSDAPSPSSDVSADAASTVASSGPTFTEAARQLDTVLERFRSETLPLEESLGLFEQAITYLKTCQTQLAGARGRVEELVKSLETDALTVQPFALNERP